MQRSPGVDDTVRKHHLFAVVLVALCGAVSFVGNIWLPFVPTTWPALHFFTLPSFALILQLISGVLIANHAYRSANVFLFVMLCGWLVLGVCVFSLVTIIIDLAAVAGGDAVQAALFGEMLLFVIATHFQWLAVYAQMTLQEAKHRRRVQHEPVTPDRGVPFAEDTRLLERVQYLLITLVVSLIALVVVVLHAPATNLTLRLLPAPDGSSSGTLLLAPFPLQYFAFAVPLLLLERPDPARARTAYYAALGGCLLAGANVMAATGAFVTNIATLALFTSAAVGHLVLFIVAMVLLWLQIVTSQVARAAATPPPPTSAVSGAALATIRYAPVATRRRMRY
jgi:hypothetical protein